MEIALLRAQGSTSLLFAKRQRNSAYFLSVESDYSRLAVVFVQETKIKGYINIVGYKVHVDENVNPGKYGFRLTHDTEKTHYFSSEEQMVVREWMKALMKATIGRDYTSES